MGVARAAATCHAGAAAGWLMTLCCCCRCCAVCFSISKIFRGGWIDERWEVGWDDVVGPQLLLLDVFQEA